MAAGIAAGMAPLLWMFERRMGRALSESERALLLDRFARLGAERLGEVALDLSRDALAAWSSDADAR